jgi:hypothetical protein
MSTETRGRSGRGLGPLVGALLVLAVLGAGCSAAGGSGGHRIPADVAAGLAARADRVAAALDAGACDQALAEARGLQGDVAALKAEPAVRAEALAGAARLVSGINCVPPTTAPPVPTTVVDPALVDNGWFFGGDGGKKGNGHGGHGGND